MSEKDISTSFAIRWRPDFRYRDDKYLEVKTDLFKSHEPSVTDKEAYRLTLASLRGAIAQGIGKIDVGSYSLKAGEEYDSRKDFSFLNRKDLTIVEVDDFIKIMSRRLEEADGDLKSQIEYELVQAQKKKEDLAKDDKNKKEEVNE